MCSLWVTPALPTAELTPHIQVRKNLPELVSILHVKLISLCCFICCYLFLYSKKRMSTLNHYWCISIALQLLYGYSCACMYKSMPLNISENWMGSLHNAASFFFLATASTRWARSDCFIVKTWEGNAAAWVLWSKKLWISAGNIPCHCIHRYTDHNN